MQNEERRAKIAASAHGVSKRFGATAALDGVHLTVHEGEVHGLVGRDGAGKSTLVSILTGLVSPDAGRLRLGGDPAPPLDDRPAWRRRVACVHQRSTLVPELSVAENLFLHRQSNGRVINWRELRKRASATLESFGVAADPRQPARDLGVEERKLVEIARALSGGARFIILDEPTVALDGAAIDRLFASIRALRDDGVTFLYVPHHPLEAFDLCHNVTVLRDGRTVLTGSVAEVSPGDLFQAADGAGTSRPGFAVDPEPLLHVENLTLRDGYADVSLTVGAGEIVGVTGSASSGTVALAETVAGLRKPGAGTVSVPAGDIGFLTGDPWHGLVPALSVAENAALPILGRLGRHGMISPKRLRANGRDVIAEFGIRSARPGTPVGSLPAGEARKVALARALAARPKVLVLVTPASGVDTGSRAALFGSVVQAAENGTGVLLVSDDLDDLRLCDRVVVMHRGRVVLEKGREWTDADVAAAAEGMSQ